MSAVLHDLETAEEINLDVFVAMAKNGFQAKSRSLYDLSMHDVIGRNVS